MSATALETRISDMLTRMGELLLDEASTRWTTPERTRTLLDMEQSIAAAIPDATPREQANVFVEPPQFTVSAPDGGGQPVRALLDCRDIRRLDTNALIGYVTPIARAALDAQRPAWATETGVPKHWIMEAGSQQSRSAVLYPRPNTTVSVSIVFTRWPVAGLTSLQVDARFKDAVLHGAVARCWLKDDTPGDRENAKTHIELARSALQAAGVADQATIQRILGGPTR